MSLALGFFSVASVFSFIYFFFQDLWRDIFSERVLFSSVGAVHLTEIEHLKMEYTSYGTPAGYAGSNEKTAKTRGDRLNEKRRQTAKAAFAKATPSSAAHPCKRVCPPHNRTIIIILDLD